MIKRKTHPLPTEEPLITSTAIIVIAVISYLANYALNAYFSHHLSPNLFGDLNIGLKMISFANMAILLGSDSSAMRFLSMYIKEKDTKLKYAFLRWMFSRTGLMIAIYLVLIAIGTSVMFLLHHFHIKALDSHHLAVYMLWIAPLYALLVISMNVIYCHDRPVLATILDKSAKNIFILVCVVTCFELLAIPMKVGTLLFVYMAAYTLAVVAQWTVVNLISPDLIATTLKNDADHSTKKQQKEWNHVALRLIINSFFYILLSTCDLLILEVFAHNESDVGVYAAILTTIVILWLIPKMIFRTVKAKISYYLKSDNGRMQLQQAINSLSKYVFLLSSLACLAMTIFAKKLLLLFGTHYTIGVTALRICVLGAYLANVSSICLPILMYGGYSKKVLRLTLLELAILFAGAIPGAYYYGAIGVACASTLAISFKVIASYYYLKKFTGLKPCVWF